MNTQCVKESINTVNLSDTFLGVYPIDEMPDITSKSNIYMIINTDISIRPGSHWVVINKPDMYTIEVFDSWGLGYHYYPLLFKYILEERNKGLKADIINFN